MIQGFFALVFLAGGALIVLVRPALIFFRRFVGRLLVGGLLMFVVGLVGILNASPAGGKTATAAIATATVAPTVTVRPQLTATAVPRLTATVTPRPTAVSATATPGERSADQDYLQALVPTALDTATNLQALSAQSTAVGEDLTLIVDPTWRANTLQALQALKLDAARMQDGNPPPAMVTINREFQQVGGVLDRSTVEYATGVDDATHGNGVAASQQIQAATTDMRSVSTIMSTINQQVSVFEAGE